MQDFSGNLIETLSRLAFPKIGIIDIIQIALIAFFVYQFMVWIKYTHAYTLLKGILVVLLFILIAYIFRMMGSIFVVRGYNDKDWAEGMAKTLHFTIEGVKFFMTYNKKDVDWDLKDTQVVIFGHTHKYFEKMIDNRLWLNPGSCGPRRFDQEITMAVMTVDNGTYQWEKVAMIPEK